MKRGFEYAPMKCNDHKITARCRVSDCPWRIKARQVPGIAQWWVKKFDSQHTCSRAIGGLGHRNCDAAFIASFVREQVVANEKYMPKMVQTEILRQHGVKISYWKAYRARELVIQEVRGDFEARSLYFLVHARVEEWRCGNMSPITLQGRGSFSPFFLGIRCSDSSIPEALQAAYWSGWYVIAQLRHCHTIISLYCTIIYYIHECCLLTASCIDGNNCILPLAWAVVEGENRYSWQWFLEQLRDGVVGDRDSSRANTVLTIVSDRQKGLIDAVSDVFPDAAHGYCIYHLSTNLPHAPRIHLRGEDFGLRLVHTL
ncbi:hypothetical protein ACMD2_20959 [Ananas comosus]|uniref:MULE transposase domain-containing protein n=1 Tax=Ananas comosus TaxID=4615 RepID=A0A199URS6_ANACO|nr:hypothetical protein ACMD2_20959 [Ananas comosus]